jgi:antitoxin (DNA-binding transcriptional repressor) of toxin-antitoxin stability system
VKSVGIRELKNKLSDYVRQVRSGETILVTDRGEVVAEMNPPGQGNVDRSLPPGLIELARRGLVTLGGRNDPSSYRRLPGVMTSEEVAELLDEVRGPR